MVECIQNIGERFFFLKEESVEKILGVSNKYTNSDENGWTMLSAVGD